MALPIGGPGAPPPTTTAETLQGQIEDKALQDKLQQAEQKTTSTEGASLSPAEQAKANAKKLAAGKAAELLATKMTDLLQIQNGPELLKSLQSLGLSTAQATAVANSPLAKDGVTHQAAEWFSVLEPLMGEPPSGAVQIAEAFSPETLRMRANEGVLLAVDTLQGLLQNFVTKLPGDEASQAQLLDELKASFGLDSALLTPPTLQGEATLNPTLQPNADLKNATILKLEKFQAIVETFFEKTLAQSPDQVVQHVPAGLIQSLKDSMAQLKPAVSALFDAAQTAASNTKPGQEVVIPGPVVLAVEKALQPVLTAQTTLLQNLKTASKEVPNFKDQIADIAKRLEAGDTPKDGEIHPALAAVLKYVMPYGSESNGGQGQGDQPQGQRLFTAATEFNATAALTLTPEVTPKQFMKDAAVKFTNLTNLFIVDSEKLPIVSSPPPPPGSSKPTEEPKTKSEGFKTPPPSTRVVAETDDPGVFQFSTAAIAKGTFADSGIDINTADISCLTYWIMMQCAQSAAEDLREVMKELKANIDAKKAQREVMQKMKENEARLKTEMRNEYDELVGEGVIKPSYSFDQYAAWRKVEYSEDGRAQLATLNYDDLPKLATEGPPKEEGERQVSGGPVPSVPGVTPLTPETAQIYADEYGVHASDIQYMYAYFMSNPALKDGDFEAYLKGGNGDPKKGCGLKAVGDPRDEAIVTANNTAVGKFFTNLKTTGKDDDKKLADDAAKAAESARGVDNATSSARLKQIEALIEKIEVIKALRDAGVDCGSTSALENELNGLLKQPLTAADEKALNTWKSTTLPQELNQLSTYLGDVGRFLNGPGKQAIDSAQNQMKGDEGDNFINGFSAGYDANGPVINAHFYEYDDANSEGDINWRGGNLDYNYDANENSVHVDASWPNAATGGPLVGVLNGLLGQNGGKIGADKMAACADKLGGTAAQAGGGWSYQGPGAGEADKPPAAPPTSTASSLATGWTSQHQTDVLNDKAAAMARQQAEKKAKEMKDKAESTTDGLAAGGKAKHVQLDEYGMDAEGLRWRQGSMAQYSAEVEAQQGKLDSLSDLSEPMQMRLQQYMDRRSKALETLSNLMKKMSQTAETIVGNMK